MHSQENDDGEETAEDNIHDDNISGENAVNPFDEITDHAADRTEYKNCKRNEDEEAGSRNDDELHIFCDMLFQPLFKVAHAEYGKKNRNEGTAEIEGSEFNADHACCVSGN